MIKLRLVDFPTHTAYCAARAYQERQRLFDTMGRECAVCGVTERDGEDYWEFDHPHGRNYNPARLNQWQRIRQYRKDWKAGNLRVLCKPCNANAGKRRYATKV